MSMFTQLGQLIDANAPAKPLKFAAKCAENPKHKRTLKMESAPKDASDDAVYAAARSKGVTASESVPTATGNETRGRETVTGLKAAAFIAAFRHGPQAALKMLAEADQTEAAAEAVEAEAVEA
jgi:hypothetical protein